LKLLLDANLSPRLIRRLADLFPGSLHVFDSGLARFTSDGRIWDFAREASLTILTADSDFLALSNERGWPPKVIRIENCSFRTPAVEALIRRYAIRVAEFEHSDKPVLILRNAQ
jgi:predicted nuclease of predicted toxin-antitoxin system